MDTTDRFLAVHNLALVQRQAGVEPQVAELVTAYGRLLVDAGQDLVFDRRPFQPGSLEHETFADLQRKNSELDERFIAFLASYSALMIERGHVPLFGRDDLAGRLGFDPHGLMAVAAKATRFYREIRLSKTSTTFRTVHSPREPLRGIQDWVLQNVLKAYRPGAAAHGFVRGRSILSNAAQHVGHSTLVVMDLEDFFPTITWVQVRKGFERLGYPYSVAVVLANVCTRGGVLPQGAPTSPALSNIVCARLDRRLSGLARSRGFHYSRYADDMAFSSDDARITSLIPFIRQVIAEEGFKVRADKTRIAKAGARRAVTGIIVNERPNLPRAHVRKLRAATHRLVHQGPEAVIVPSRRTGSDPQAVLAGHLGFLAMINPARGRALTRL